MWLPSASLLLCLLVNSAFAQSTGSNQPNAYQANINAQVDIKPLYDLVNSVAGGSQSFGNPQYDNPYTINGANAYGQQQNAGANPYGTPQTAYPTYSPSSSAQYGANSYGGSQYAGAQYGGNAYSGAQNGASGYDPSNTGLYANLNGQQLNVGFNDPYQQQTAYGQQASSSTGAGGSGFVVRNPNSQFVPQLRSLMSDVQSGKTIDFNGRITASGTGSGTLGGAADSSQVHSNEDMNHRNYQDIKSRFGTGGTQGQQFTNNIYGYDYRSNPDMKYTINGNEAQYQPPQYSRYEPPPGSPFGRKRRQATYQPFNERSSFAGTAYQNQEMPFQRDNSVMPQQPLFYNPSMMDKSFPSAPRSNWQFYDHGMNMTAMYYPYRTTVEEHPIG